MKKLVLCLAVLLIAGCTTPIKYEKQTITPPPKASAYKLPVDPFAGTPAPDTIYLKHDSKVNTYIICTKEEAEIIGFTSKDLNRITLRLQYYKDLSPQLENLINLHIQRENLLIDLIVDQDILKELLREFNVDLQNKINSDKFWGNVEKGGYWGIILGLIIEAAILAAH